MTHPVFNLKEIERIEITHKKPEKFRDHFALGFLRVVRKSFDILTRYNPEKMNE
jgi:hypothetical protein